MIKSWLDVALYVTITLALWSWWQHRAYKGLLARYHFEKRLQWKFSRWYGVVVFVPFVVAPRLMVFLLLFGLFYAYGRVLKNQKRELAFQQFSYRAYRYLNMQIRSGVRLEDSLGRLCQMTSNKVLSQQVEAFSSHYLRRFQLDEAMDVLKEYEDSYLLRNALQRFDSEGAQSLYGQEEALMFEKYLTALRIHNKNRRQQMVLIGMAYLLLLVMMMLVPIVIQMFQATKLIFT